MSPLPESIAKANAAAFNRLVQSKEGRSRMICDLVERHRDYLCIEIVMIEQLILAEETAGPDDLSHFNDLQRVLAEKIASKPFSEILKSAQEGRDAALRDLRAMLAMRKAEEAIAELQAAKDLLRDTLKAIVEKSYLKPNHDKFDDCQVHPDLIAWGRKALEATK